MNICLLVGHIIQTDLIFYIMSVKSNRTRLLDFFKGFEDQVGALQLSYSEASIDSTAYVAINMFRKIRSSMFHHTEVILNISTKAITVTSRAPHVIQHLLNSGFSTDV